MGIWTLYAGKVAILGKHKQEHNWERWSQAIGKTVWCQVLYFVFWFSLQLSKHSDHRLLPYRCLHICSTCLHLPGSTSCQLLHCQLHFASPTCLPSNCTLNPWFPFQSSSPWQDCPLPQSSLPPSRMTFPSRILTSYWPVFRYLLLSTLCSNWHWMEKRSMTTWIQVHLNSKICGHVWNSTLYVTYITVNVSCVIKLTDNELLWLASVWPTLW